MDTRFHCVYLLTSLDPQCAGDFYVGYTVDPLRRLRQHNGELVNGAKRTHRHGRPWCLVCCVSGFAEDRTALKFEWSWQHPRESKRLRHYTSTLLEGLRRLPSAVAVLHCLVRADIFAMLELTLHIFETEKFEEAAAAARAYIESRVVKKGLTLAHFEGDPIYPFLQSEQSVTLPPLLPTALFTIEPTTSEAFRKQYLQPDTSVLLPASRSPSPLPDDGSLSPSRYDHYTDQDYLQEMEEDAALCRQGWWPCTLCGLPLQFLYTARCAHTPHCPLKAHLTCLCMYWMYTNGEYHDGRGLIPEAPCPCPLCGTTLHWAAVTKTLKRRAVVLQRIDAEGRRRQLQSRVQERMDAITAEDKAEKQLRRRKGQPPPLRSRLNNTPTVNVTQRGRKRTRALCSSQGEESFIPSQEDSVHLTQASEGVEHHCHGNGTVDRENDEGKQPGESNKAPMSQHLSLTLHTIDDLDAWLLQ